MPASNAANNQAILHAKGMMITEHGAHVVLMIEDKNSDDENLLNQSSSVNAKLPDRKTSTSNCKQFNVAMHKNCYHIDVLSNMILDVEKD